MASSVELIQIYYEEPQKASLYDFATPYFNDRLTIFFESAEIPHLVRGTGDTTEKVAVCSWRLREKMMWQRRKPRELTRELLETTDFEVLSFTNNSRQHNMLGAAEVWHPGFSDTLRLTLDLINKPMPYSIHNAIYQNHFAARRDIYFDYVNNWLIPAIGWMISHPVLNKKVLADAKYADHGRRSPEYLMEKIGIPHYPIAPFVLERLFSIYCHHNNIPITWL